ncbi:MAG: DUF4249 family protein [Bacteroidia bacterium]
MNIPYIRLAIASLTALFLLASCETDLKVDLPEHDRKLVVNAIQQQDSAFIVHLSKSYGFQEEISESKLLIDNAKVELWEGTTLLDELVFRDTFVNPYWNWDPDAPADLRLGHYYSPKNLKAEQGRQYELRISHPELGQAIGRMELPEPVDPVAVEFFPDTITFTDFDGYIYHSSVARIQLAAQQPQGLFYTVRVSAEYTYPLDSSLRDTTPFYLEGSLTTWSQASAEYSSSNWAGNQPDNTLDFSIGGEVNRVFYVNGEEVDWKPSKIFVEMIATDEATYRYLNGIEKQRESDPGNPFYPSEAIIVPSNVDGAYGVFGGIVRRSYVVE